MKFSLSLIILFQILYFAFPADDRLVFLYTHFRHGARAPLDINDEFIDKLGEKWTNPGELTGVGQRMHYLLGLRNRKKYITGDEKFLSEKFDPHEMLIFSSNVNRTMVSCSSQLQGLYPQIDEVGYILTEGQKEIAMPQVNISDPEIQKEINDLGNSALPHLMQLAPVRMAGDNDRKMNVYDLEECQDERDEQKKYNNENIPELKEYIKSFNEKYAEKWNKYFNKEKAEFDVNEINDICDAFLSDYADARPMSDFKSKSGVNFTEQNEDCLDFFDKLYLYSYHGDKDKVLAHLDSSKIMKELAFYMKRRLDADMSPEKEDENYKDYSYPRMIMTSGHDSTVSADQIYIIRALGLNESDIYRFPRYATQLAIETRTAKSEGSAKSYSDYTVHGYLDDRKIFEVSADRFINKIENEAWSDEEISDYCGFDDKNKNNNSTSSDDDDDGDNAKKAYKILMIVFICLTALLLAACIFLGIKLSRAKPTPPIDPNFSSNITQNNLQ